MFSKQKGRLIFRPMYIVCFVCIILAVLCFLFVTKPGNIVKTAVTEDAIQSTDYILCEAVAITGYNWRVVGGSEADFETHLCNIEGSTPYRDLALSIDFELAPNTYVFYVEDVHSYYDKGLADYNTIYTVSGWDILYPVDHGGIFPFLGSKWHITTKDLIREYAF